MRARTFWIALPLAILLALWLGPGLAVEGEVPPDVLHEPAIEDAQAVPPSPSDPECEPAHDPGPDGDR